MASKKHVRASRVSLGSRRYVLLSYPRPGREAGSLTEAEREVALAALAGMSNAEIARLRGSSPRTVANQLASVFQKLGVRSRAELALSWPAGG